MSTLNENDAFNLDDREGELDLMEMTPEKLRSMNKDEINLFIRISLNHEKSSRLMAQCYPSHYEYRRIGRRFEMSGYESNTGDCVLHNTSIVNLFAYLGIYNYSKFLYLDFYKGNGIIYMDGIEEEMGGHTTTEIIYKILELTVLSNKTERRRT